ncbi:hypothetical protein HOK96_03190 [bacterium]|nr:hypothetical protein [bacterium]MBT5346024.1 hypothetical protein [bacterium]
MKRYIFTLLFSLFSFQVVNCIDSSFVQYDTSWFGRQEVHIGLETETDNNLTNKITQKLLTLWTDIDLLRPVRMDQSDKKDFAAKLVGGFASLHHYTVRLCSMRRKPGDLPAKFVNSFIDALEEIDWCLQNMFGQIVTNEITSMKVIFGQILGLVRRYRRKSCLLM